MKRVKVFLINTSSIAFRPMEPAIILNVEMCTPDGEGKEPRICYHIQYSDFFEDWVPLTDVADGYSKLVTQHDLIIYYGRLSKL